MTYLYIKWVWWEADSPEIEIPVLTYSKIDAEDLEVERFELYRKDRVWGYCDDSQSTGRTMLAEGETSIAHPDWGVDKINAAAQKNGDSFYLSAISAPEYYLARKTHIGIDLPDDLV